MNRRRALDLVPGGTHPNSRTETNASSVFEQQFVQQLLVAFTPKIRQLIKEVIADEGGRPLVVDYEEAGRMIGTTYEGVRKLVRKGRLTAVSRSGRHRGIAVAELKDYVQRSQVVGDWHTTIHATSNFGS
jgi:hypothetical protein